MLAEFKIINDPIRPSICTNLCSTCYRNKADVPVKVGCCTYEPEFSLFDLAYIYIYHPNIFQLILDKGQIIDGYNGVMIITKSGLNRCPFGSNQGCILPRDAMTPLCRLYICREATIFAPSIIEEKFDEYFNSTEYKLNNLLNKQWLDSEISITKQALESFIKKNIQGLKEMLAEVSPTDRSTQVFTKEIDLNDFGRIP